MKIKLKVKSYMIDYAPAIYNLVRCCRFFFYCKKRYGAFQREFAHNVYNGAKVRVLAGPFKGMRYFNKIVWGLITPKWIGSYEKELHPIMEEIDQIAYKRILDIGAAEGYYAVGLSMRFPGTEVFSFDVDPIARLRQRHLAKLNSVKNLTIGKYCSHEKLTNLLIKRTLLICDIEGFEYELLNVDLVRTLLEIDILVEIHAFDTLSSTEVKEALIKRFSESHIIATIQSEDRIAADWSSAASELEGIDERILRKALNEHRPAPQEWLWMRSVRDAGINRGTSC